MGDRGTSSPRDRRAVRASAAGGARGRWTPSGPPLPGPCCGPVSGVGSGEAPPQGPPRQVPQGAMGPHAPLCAQSHGDAHLGGVAGDDLGGHPRADVVGTAHELQQVLVLHAAGQEQAAGFGWRRLGSGSGRDVCVTARPPQGPGRGRAMQSAGGPAPRLSGLRHGPRDA